MIDFIVDLFTDIGAFFVELWVNKILGKKRKKNEQQDEKEPPKD